MKGLCAVFVFFVLFGAGTACFADDSQTNSLPDFLTHTKFFGDVRLRYEEVAREYEVASSPYTAGETLDNSDRYRFRLRGGFETTIEEHVLLGARLASGSQSIPVAATTSWNLGEQPWTANQSMADDFDRKAIWIDQAYIKLKPFDFWTLSGGKIENPFFVLDTIFDSNVTPEGFYTGFAYAFKDGPALTLGGGYFPLSELKPDGRELLAIQATADMKFGPSEFKLGVAQYDFNVHGTSPYWYQASATTDTVTDSSGKKTTVVTGATPTYVFNGNTADPTNTLYVYDYDIFDVLLEITPYVFDTGDMKIPIKLQGDWFENTASDVKQNTGWLVGLQVGKITKKGDFQISYNYRYTEADAVLGDMHFADFGNGYTGTAGSTLSASYSFYKNTWLTFTWLNADSIDNKATVQTNTAQAANPTFILAPYKRTNSSYDTYQVDLSVKF